MTVLEEARDAVANAIAKRANGDTIECSVEALGKLAHAVSELEHGPQGGAMDYDYTSDQTSRHEPPKKPNGGAGFAGAPL